MNIVECVGTNLSSKYVVTLVPGEYVLVERKENGSTVSLKKFEPGDLAEHDSFNLRYTATVRSVTAKSIVFDLGGGRTKRMKPAEFAWRNWDFDAATVRAKNAETSQHI